MNDSLFYHKDERKLDVSLCTGPEIRPEVRAELVQSVKNAIEKAKFDKRMSIFQK
jgi:hypothetical protein